MVSKLISLSVTVGLSLMVSSCSTTISDFSILPRQNRPSSRQVEEQAAPRNRAALQLTEEGRTLLMNGSVDDAIGAFERSLSLDSSNGQNYYYLAEAWLMKGNVEQAREFNQLAGLRLEAQREWMRRVEEQRQRIDAIAPSDR